MEPTKEQRNIIERNVSDVLVSAAAGSGKTAVMTERIVSRIAKRQLDVGQILVMTFTDAAASQMKLRIEQKLAERKNAAVHDSDRQYLSHQQTLLAGAAVSTIHSFCLTLVRNFTYLAVDQNGQPLLEPGFTTADANQAELLLQESLDDVLRARYETIDLQPEEERPWTADFLRLVNSFSTSRSDRPLRELIIKIYTYLRSLPDYTAQLDNYRRQIAQAAADFGASPHAAVLMQQAKRLIKHASHGWFEIETRLDQGVEMVKDKASNQESLSQIRRFIACLKDADEELCREQPSWDRLVNIAAAMGEAPKLRMPSKGHEDLRELILLLRRHLTEAVYCLTGEWGTPANQQYFLFDTQPIFTHATTAVETEISAMQPVLNQLFDLILLLDETYRQKKAQLGQIDFSDFEHIALAILKTEEARAYYHNRFREIYLDEYQDTSSIQNAILESIGQSNIFMVGDIKQSIYRFRHARPQLFLERSRFYQQSAPEQFLTLNRNFRSVPGILAAVNEVFSQLMTKAAGELDYDETHILREHRPSKGEQPPVKLWLLQDHQLPPDATEDEDTEPEIEAETTILSEDEEDALDLGDSLPYEKEAQAVRTEIEALLAAGHTAQDIVVLARTKKQVRIFAQALQEAKIDALEETGQQLFDSPELRLLVALLQLMDNPLQDIPLAAVMRSGLFEGGFTPPEMLKIRIAAKKAVAGSAAVSSNDFYHQAMIWYSQSGPETALAKRLQRFLAWIDLWREKERTMKIGEWLNLLLEQSGYFSQVAAVPGGSDRLRDVQALIDWIYSFERTRQRGLFDLVRYIEKLIGSGVAQSPFPLEISTRQAIRVMTIHRSKGLEFPIVFVVGLTGKITPKERRDPVLFSENLGIGFDWIDPDLHQRRMTHLKLALLAEQKAAGLAEELRLLYVAMTRAKDQLYLTAMLNKGLSAELIERLNQVRAWPEQVLPSEWVLSGHSYLEWLLIALARHPAFDFSAFNESFEPGFQLQSATKGVWEIRQTSIESAIRYPQSYPDSLQKGQKSADLTAEAANQLCRLFSATPRVDAALVSEALARISGDYAYPAAARRPIKLSVSELKRLEQQEQRFDEDQTLPLPGEARGINLTLKPLHQKLEQPAGTSFELPLLKGAELGTALHSLLRYLDLKALREADSKMELVRQLEHLTQAGALTRQEQRSIEPHLEQVIWFAASELTERMIRADVLDQHLYREMPFTLAVSAQAIWPADAGFAPEDQVLVQGIIDGWFIESGKAIVFDYKTDHLSGDPGQHRAELLRRYARQIHYYAQAIEKATRLLVTEHCLIHLTGTQIYTYTATEIEAALQKEKTGLADEAGL